MILSILSVLAIPGYVIGISILGSTLTPIEQFVEPYDSLNLRGWIKFFLQLGVMLSLGIGFWWAILDVLQAPSSLEMIGAPFDTSGGMVRRMAANAFEGSPLAQWLGKPLCMIAYLLAMGMYKITGYALQTS